MSSVRVTDTIGPAEPVVVDRSDVAEAITGWFPDAPESVTEAIGSLQDALNRHDPTEGHEAFLGIRIERED